MFQIHRVSMVTTFCLTAAAFVIIFVEKKEFSNVCQHSYDFNLIMITIILPAHIYFRIILHLCIQLYNSLNVFLFSMKDGYQCQPVHIPF